MTCSFLTRPADDCFNAEFQKFTANLALSGAQNFTCSIIDSELTGRLTDAAGNPTPAATLLDSLDKAFTAIFTVELAVNMASNLWTRFVHDPWCLLSCSLPLPLCFLSLSSVLPPFIQAIISLPFRHPSFSPSFFPFLPLPGRSFETSHILRILLFLVQCVQRTQYSCALSLSLAFSQNEGRRP